MASAGASATFGLHSSYCHPTLRRWQSTSSSLDTSSLMLPLFIVDDPNDEQAIPSMPGVKRMGENRALQFVTSLVRKGLQAVLLFSVTSAKKTPTGEIGASPSNPVVSATRLLKANIPELLVACDVCLCPFTDHGHCGAIGSEGYIDNGRSIDTIAKIARVYAEAGADIVAPSDMMDGRVRAIKVMLKEIGYLNREKFIFGFTHF